MKHLLKILFPLLWFGYAQGQDIFGRPKAYPLDSAGATSLFYVGQKPTYGGSASPQTLRGLSPDSLLAWLIRQGGGGGGFPIVDISTSAIKALASAHSLDTNKRYRIYDAYSGMLSFLALPNTDSTISRQGTGRFKNSAMSTAVSAFVVYDLNKDKINYIYEPTHNNLMTADKDYHTGPPYPVTIIQLFRWDDSTQYNNQFNDFLVRNNGTGIVYFGCKFSNLVINFNSTNTHDFQNIHVEGSKVINGASDEITFTGSNTHWACDDVWGEDNGTSVSNISNSDFEYNTVGWFCGIDCQSHTNVDINSNNWDNNTYFNALADNINIWNNNFKGEVTCEAVGDVIKCTMIQGTLTNFSGHRSTTNNVTHLGLKVTIDDSYVQDCNILNTPSGGSAITTCNLLNSTINFGSFTNCTLSNVYSINSTLTFIGNNQTISNQIWLNNISIGVDTMYLNGTSDSLIWMKYNRRHAIPFSGGGGTTTDTLKNGYGISGGNFNGSANVTWSIDSATLASYFLRRKDTTNTISGWTTLWQNSLKLAKSDTTGQWLNGIKISHDSVFQFKNGSYSFVGLVLVPNDTVSRAVDTKFARDSAITANVGSGAWKITGNSGTNSGSNFLGTTDSKGLSIRTNNTIAARFDSLQRVGFGVTPECPFQVDFGGKRKLVIDDTISGGGDSFQLMGNIDAILLSDTGLAWGANNGHEQNYSVVCRYTNRNHGNYYHIFENVTENSSFGKGGYGYWGRGADNFGDTNVHFLGHGTSIFWRDSLPYRDIFLRAKGGIKYGIDSTSDAITYTFPLTAGTSGQVPTSNGTGSAWTWTTPATGTVTNFSAGNLSPLFTTNVTLSSTAPSLSFSQINQSQNLVYASPNGSTGVPTFRALVAADLPAISAALTSSYVGYGSGSNLLTGDANFTWQSSVRQFTAGITGQDSKTFFISSDTLGGVFPYADVAGYGEFKSSGTTADGAFFFGSRSPGQLVSIRGLSIDIPNSKVYLGDQVGSNPLLTLDSTNSRFTFNKDIYNCGDSVHTSGVIGCSPLKFRSDSNIFNGNVIIKDSLKIQRLTSKTAIATDATGKIIAASAIDTSITNAIAKVNVNAPLSVATSGKSVFISADTSTGSTHLATQNYVATHGTSSITRASTTISGGASNNIPYDSSGVIGEIVNAANSVLITSSGNVPSLSQTLPSAVQGNITSTGTITSGTWNGTAVDYTLAAYNALGGAIKAQTVGQSMGQLTASASLQNQVAVYVAVYVPQTFICTGIKWYQALIGSYNTQNYNGVAIYSYSGGTLSIVDSTTRDSTIWKTYSNTWGSKAWGNGTHSLSPGLYYIAFLYCSAFQNTAPTIGKTAAMLSTTLAAGDFTNSALLFSHKNSTTVVPGSVTMSSMTGEATGDNLYVGLY